MIHLHPRCAYRHHKEDFLLLEVIKEGLKKYSDMDADDIITI